MVRGLTGRLILIVFFLLFSNSFGLPMYVTLPPILHLTQLFTTHLFGRWMLRFICCGAWVAWFNVDYLLLHN
ncbi:hypothetical protein L211DRAFT_439539 [Terfezia boudieri ATCC MYA-4762]|uniref:Uncharacterized protein n=1 Tax=Terfezia boudieri ATCC MYA-4762 TaxID=1051890 RepID=A0A3N4LLG3_9PEZI|nr:hypothetical protein L211DRAFT_439539 [Terfezia boudieri ATCC MYA-4762]